MCSWVRLILVSDSTADSGSIWSVYVCGAINAKQALHPQVYNKRQKLVLWNTHMYKHTQLEKAVVKFYKWWHCVLPPYFRITPWTFDPFSTYGWLELIVLCLIT